MFALDTWAVDEGGSGAQGRPTFEGNWSIDQGRNHAIGRESDATDHGQACSKELD